MAKSSVGVSQTQITFHDAKQNEIWQANKAHDGNFVVGKINVTKFM